MGVQHLWSILEDAKRGDTTERLRGKTLCIDLSLWICEAQGTRGLQDQLKPYLRNVFFRTMYLTSIGVRPVFVIDGIPPDIKQETILKRLQTRPGVSSTRTFGGRNIKKQGKLKRSRFTICCNECCEMLRLLGIPFVKSEGEAEAMCAWLNVNKYADGVLTDDGDVFLYGAEVVYKDFNISSKDPAECLQVYDMKNIENDLGLNRRNMIALALLLGCDYVPTGVPGIGKETAVRFLNSLSGVDLLDRFQEWKVSPETHPKGYSSFEVSMKRKAVKVHDFPNKAVINEFLSPRIGIKNIVVKWTCPDLEGIKDFFLHKLDWPREYTEEKMFNLATDWQLAHMQGRLQPLFVPLRVVKQRTKQRLPYYELEWETQKTGNTWPSTFICTKPKKVIDETYSLLVESFEKETLAKKSKSKTKKRPKTTTFDDNGDEIQDLISRISGVVLDDKPAVAALHVYNEDLEVTSETPVQIPSHGNALDIRPMDERPRSLSESDISEKSDSSDQVSDGGARLKLGTSTFLSASPCSTLLDEYSDILKPKSCDKDNKAAMVDLKISENQDEVSLCLENFFSTSKHLEVTGDCTSRACDEKRCGIRDRVCALSGAGTPSASPDLISPKSEFNKFSKCVFSPANDKTVLNLVDITMEESLEIDFGNMEDLLASSFLAKLKEIPNKVQPSPCRYSESVLSPSLHNPYYDLPSFGNIAEELEKDSVCLTYGNENLMDSFKRVSISTTVCCQEKGISEGNHPNVVTDEYLQSTDNQPCVTKCSTPLVIEESSLTSRLLKRFRKNTDGMADTLRLISANDDVPEQKPQSRANTDCSTSNNREQPKKAR